MITFSLSLCLAILGSALKQYIPTNISMFQNREVTDVKLILRHFLCKTMISTSIGEKKSALRLLQI